MVVPRETPPRFYSPRLAEGEPRTCRVCGRPVDPSEKRHVHQACAIRLSRGTLLGPSCAACNTTDPRVLRLVRLADGKVTLCANHAAIAGRRPITIDALRAELHVESVAA
jgi:hypothetical protein